MPLSTRLFAEKDIEGAHMVTNIDEDVEVEEDAEEVNDVASSDEEQDDRIRLASGEALDTGSVDQFLLKRDARIIAIVGEQESGKTTLICSLYDRFCHDSFSGFSFAGSDTLVGFERRMHYSRWISGRSTPETLRTSASESIQFYHLALADSNCSLCRTDLLLSDRAGESYVAARDNSDALSGLIEVAKADVLVFLRDGGRLVIPNQRAGALYSARQTLRAFLDGGLIGADTAAQVVTTKYDLILSDPDKEHVMGHLQNANAKLYESFGDRLASLTFWDVAARDPKGILEPAWQVDQLLRSWTSARVPPRAPCQPSQLRLINEFDRLLVRTPLNG